MLQRIQKKNQKISQRVVILKFFPVRNYRLAFLLLLTFSFLGLSNNVISASLNARVDRTNISIDETLNLSITYNGETKQSDPDLTQLETQFDILSRNQSSRVQYTNGSVSSSTEWSYTLGPKNVGKLIIPSFKIDGAFSDAVEITVSQSTASNSYTGQNLYIETSVNKDSVYVQEQLILTQRLYIAANVNVDQLDPEALSLNNVILEELPGAKYTKKIGQKTYYVFEYSYAIFPQSSTDFVIPSLRWNLRVAQRSRNSVFDRLGNYQIKRLRTQEKSIKVKAKPSSYPATMPWLPATDIRLSQDWSKGTDTFKIGEPITRTITIEAEGLTSSQLPQFIKDSNSNGIKLYIDQPQLNDEQTDNGVVGRRIESAAIVVTRNGEVTIPATRVPWWNTAKDRLEYLELEAKTLLVKGPEVGGDLTDTNATNDSTENTSNGNISEQIDKQSTDLDIENASLKTSSWKTAAIAFLVSTMVLLALYLREIFLRQRNEDSENDASSSANKSVSEKKYWKQLQSVLASERYKEARSLILEWSNSIEEHNFSSLQQLNSLNDSENLLAATAEIDNLLYADKKTQNKLSSQAANKKILAHLTKYREQKLNAKKANQKVAGASLKPLHPNP